MEQTETSSNTTGNSLREESLVKTDERTSDSEKNLISHIRSVKAHSDKWDGRCGKIIDVSSPEEIKTPEAFENAVRELKDVSEDLEMRDNIVLSGDRVLRVNDTLAEIAGTSAGDSNKVVVTVQLPGIDERTFSEMFEVMTFESAAVDNDLSKLYHDVLDLDADRDELLTGNWVPVKQTSDTGDESFEIDIDRGLTGSESTQTLSNLLPGPNDLPESGNAATMLSGTVMLVLACTLMFAVLMGAF